MKHIILITLLVLCLCVLPVSAVSLEVTVKGTVSGLIRENNTLTIADPAQYGCSYPAGGAPVCLYTPLINATLSGSVPAESAFSLFTIGDPIVATSIRDAGGQWITLAKLSGNTVTDIVGDPSTVPAPLAGDYRLELSTEPDCTTCSGTTCTATTSYVRVMSGTTLLMAQDLEPGHAMTYSGRNDGSSVTVTFMKGQASSSTCAGRDTMMTGGQPVSVYIVHVVPPIGSGVQAAETPSATPVEVTMPAEAQPTPTRSGMLPLVAIGALALVVVFGVSRLK
jgi:hypothetical protein